MKKTEDGEILLLNDGIYRVIISDNFEFEIEKIIEGEVLWHVTELESEVYLYNDQGGIRRFR